MNDLHSELAALADEVRPAELLGRVYGTSRRLRRRRQALAAGSAVLAGALTVGVLLLPQGHEEKTTPPVVTPTLVAPALGTPKAFVPQVTESGGRKHMSLTLPNGTNVIVSYPASENFEKTGMESYWSLNNDECCGHATAWIPQSAQFKGYVFDGAGTRLEAWQAPLKDIGSDAEGDNVWFRYGDWFFDAGPADAQAHGEDLSAYYPTVRKLRLEHTPDGMLKVIPMDGLKFQPAFNSLDSDVLDGPSIVFRQGNDYEVDVVPANNCEGPAEAPIMEWRGPQICTDGIMIRMPAARSKTWQDKVRHLAATLRIDKVTGP